MDGAYGIGITNRYAFLLDAGGNDPQTILKKKVDQAKKAAKKAARAEKAKNLENNENIVPSNTNSDNWNDSSDNWNDGKVNVDGSKGQNKGYSRRQQQQPMKAENSDWGNEAPSAMDANGNDIKGWENEPIAMKDNRGNDIKGWDNQPTPMSDTKGNDIKGWDNKPIPTRGSGNTNNMDWKNRNNDYDQPERTDYRPPRKQYDRNVGNRRPGYGGGPQRSLGKREHDGYSGSEANVMDIKGWDDEPIPMSDTRGNGNTNNIDSNNRNNAHRRQPNNYNRNNGTEKPSGGRNRTNNYENRNIDNNFQYADNNPQYNNQPERDHRPPRKQHDRNYGGEHQRPFGKREHDRHSGSDKTGVKAVDKREGGGAHNWGTHKQDIEDITKGYSDTDLKDGSLEKGYISEEKGYASEEKGLVSEEKGYVAEKEEAMLTYDEFQATKLAREKPVYNTRQAGEGEDTKKYDAMIVLPNKKDNNDAMIVVPNKKNNNANEEVEYEPYDPSLYPQRHGRLKHYDIPIKFSGSDRFKRQDRRGGNREHNGNAPDNRRGGGRRNDPRSPNSHYDQTAPEIDDCNFPSLA